MNPEWRRELERRQRQGDGTAVIDSAATSSFWREEDPHIKTNVESGKRVMMPNGHMAVSSKKAKLPNTKLNDAARDLDLLPELKDNSLLSVCKLADAGYTTIFHAENGGVTVHWAGDVYIKVKKEAIMRGWHDESGLWRVPIKDRVENENTDTLLIQRPMPKEGALNVYELPSIRSTIRYLHAALGFPTKATMLRAIRNKWLLTWPGLTVENVNKFFPESDETWKGHAKGQRQGVRSTKPKHQQDEEAQEAELNAKLRPGVKKHDVYFKIWDAKEKMYTDQTGRFPVQSKQGNRYMMVLVEIDSNYIDAEPMKNRSQGEMIRAYQALLERIKSTGVCDPKHHMLDNEASAEFQKVIREQAKLQLVPPDTHRRNIAERVI